MDTKPAVIRDSVRVLVASDWAPIRAFEPIMRRDPLAVYGDLLPLIQSADLRIVNCECALTAARRPVWKSGAVFKGAPARVRGLQAVPFDVACLANNHVFDYGLTGFRETLSVLRRRGIRTVGAGLTEKEAAAALTIRVGSARISILNFGEGEDLTAARGGPGVCGWDIDKIASRVEKLKKRGDLVLVVAHGGLEYVPFPPPYVRQAFRALVDAGADCVVGHHPHVPQGIEIIKGRLIAYSLGNFVFYQNTGLYYRKVGYCLGLTLKGGEVSGWEILPYRITNAGLRRLKGMEAADLADKLLLISKPLRSPSQALLAWQAYLDHYGLKGFMDEVLGILKRMRTEPRTGAAMFRNRLTTLQHAELWRDTLTRSISDDRRRAPVEYRRLVEEWFTRAV